MNLPYTDDGYYLFDYPNGSPHTYTSVHSISEPMKRISRFLYGNWPSGKLKSFLSGEFYGSGSAQYSDYLGNRHERKVFVENRVWQITDNISGFSSSFSIKSYVPGNKIIVSGNKLFRFPTFSF